MNKQGVNPYLPSWEYVPDGEPHVFGNRVYVYGSHDRFGASFFCLNDYVCWSAPIADLTDWRYEGVIYHRNQDSYNKSGWRTFFAPDVTCGPDGRYYLYYTLDFVGRMAMSVAVCDTPAGKYEFLGHVRFPDGHVWGDRSGEPYPFDPGVLTDEDGRVYLYSGFATKIPFVASAFRNLTNDGGVVFELEKDMLTIKEGPRLLFPRKGMPGAFKGHGFFEASSIRKINGKYVFTYSSEHNHELCYAVGDSPMGTFTFGGTLVDLGDLFLDGNMDEKKAKNYLGNTHGGMLQIEDQFYIFYHRHTNRHSYSRQACAEKLEYLDDSRFCQAEITSCGLNPEPLKGEGEYEARIACNLWSGKGTGRYDMKFPRIFLKGHPYFTQDGKDREDGGNQYIANMRDGSVAGFKYFAIDGVSKISIKIRGNAKGRMLVSDTADFVHVAAEIPISIRDARYCELESDFHLENGKKALYFQYVGNGKLDFYAFTLIK